MIDAEGNRVAATLTINWLFGSGIVAGTTGVLLNNEMDDFSFDPEVPNSYRLHGSDANAVAPGKRPLSSMTPAFVEDGKGVLVLGAPGGPRIVSQVLLGDTRLPGSAAGKSIWSASCGRRAITINGGRTASRSSRRAFRRSGARRWRRKGHRLQAAGRRVGQHAARVQVEGDRGSAGGERSAGARCRLVL